MTRVIQVIDLNIDRKLFIIWNKHLNNADRPKSAISYGKEYYPLKKDMKHSEKYLYSIWKQITCAFNENYDENLIEGLNEQEWEVWLWMLV